MILGGEERYRGLGMFERRVKPEDYPNEWELLRSMHSLCTDRKWIPECVSLDGVVHCDRKKLLIDGVKHKWPLLWVKHSTHYSHGSNKSGLLSVGIEASSMENMVKGRISISNTFCRDEDSFRSYAVILNDDGSSNFSIYNSDMVASVHVGICPGQKNIVSITGEGCGDGVIAYMDGAWTSDEACKIVTSFGIPEYIVVSIDRSTVLNIADYLTRNMLGPSNSQVMADIKKLIGKLLPE